MPLCLTFIDLKKAFDPVVTEAVMKALDNQGVPTQNIKGANPLGYKNIKDVVKKIMNTLLCAHLFNTSVLPALTYASETWAFGKQEENAVGVIKRSVGRVIAGVSASRK
ncbi:hypothetical protein RB195_005452 [Necator americanus]|uniref:Reverse transcriptase domain-containing protein n=1 Tax=Necator americanus TaxID=51031 RepID=A0ABR1BMY3_NECAM